MTYIYFVRHAESDKTVRDGRVRPLTEKGLLDAQRLPLLFRGLRIDKIYSSPFKRAIDTVKPIADTRGMDITVVEDLRERKSDSVQTISMPELIEKQWEDFTYTLSDGECFQAVQDRNLRALGQIVKDHHTGTVMIGTHGVALCTMIRHFRPLDKPELTHILLKLPYIVRMTFDGDRYIEMEEMDYLG